MSATTKKDTVQLISFPAFKDSRGELCFVQSGAPQLPFDPKESFGFMVYPKVSSEVATLIVLVQNLSLP